MSARYYEQLTTRKLEERVSEMIRQLDAIPYHIVANRELDKFYYMQKLAELKLMDDRLQEALECVRVIIAGRYDTRQEVMLRWKKDVRWLQEQLRKER